MTAAGAVSCNISYHFWIQKTQRSIPASPPALSVLIFKKHILTWASAASVKTLLGYIRVLSQSAPFESQLCSPFLLIANVHPGR